LPVGLHAHRGRLEIEFTDPLDAKAVTTGAFEIKVWGLKRTQNYGSKHIDERPLMVARATPSPDGRTISLEIPDLAPTRGMEIKYRLQGADGRPIAGTIHNTIHQLGK
jgi:hypothetical protein